MLMTVSELVAAVRRYAADVELRGDTPWLLKPDRVPGHLKQELLDRREQVVRYLRDTPEAQRQGNLYPQE